MLYAFRKGIQTFCKHEGTKSCINILEAFKVLWQARNWSRLMWSEQQIVKGLFKMLTVYRGQNFSSSLNRRQQTSQQAETGI